MEYTKQNLPLGAAVGTVWYDHENQRTYYKSENRRWISVDQDDFVVDIIDEFDENVEAYNRAMRVL